MATDYLSYLAVAKDTRGGVSREVMSADLRESVVVAKDSDFITKEFPNGIPKSYNNNKLTPEDLNIIRLKLAGYKQGEIARIVDKTEGYVSNVINHPEAAAIIEQATQEILRETVTTVKKEFVAHAHEAFRTTLSLLRTCSNPRIRLEAARDIIKVAGVGDEKTDNSNPIDAKSAAIISNTLRELFSETPEYTPLGNSADLEAIKNAASDAEAIEELIAVTDDDN